MNEAVIYGAALDTPCTGVFCAPHFGFKVVCSSCCC